MSAWAWDANDSGIQALLLGIEESLRALGQLIVQN
jgi:hypothetical protein